MTLNYISRMALNNCRSGHLILVQPKMAQFHSRCRKRRGNSSLGSYRKACSSGLNLFFYIAFFPVGGAILKANNTRLNFEVADVLGREVEQFNVNENLSVFSERV